MACTSRSRGKCRVDCLLIYCLIDFQRYDRSIGFFVDCDRVDGPQRCQRILDTLSTRRAAGVLHLEASHQDGHTLIVASTVRPDDRENEIQLVIGRRRAD